MRIHLQNPANHPLFDFSRAMWDAAVARAPDIGLGRSVSLDVTPTDFPTATRDAEAFVADADVIKARFPREAPRLKRISPANPDLGQPALFTRRPKRFNIGGAH